MNKPQRTLRLPGLLKNGLPDLHATSNMLSVANGMPVTFVSLWLGDQRRTGRVAPQA